MNYQMQYDKLPDRQLEREFQKLAEKQHRVISIITSMSNDTDFAPKRLPELELITLGAINEKLEDIFHQVVIRNKWKDTCYHCGHKPEQHPHQLCDLGRNDVEERIRLRHETGIVAVDELIKLRDSLFKI